LVTKRIIPCLDIKDKVVVKGVNFKSLEYAGDAIELSMKYYEEYADELVNLNRTCKGDCQSNKNTFYGGRRNKFFRKYS